MARKVRHCRKCGEKLPAERLWLCESCQAAGFGLDLKAGCLDGRELLEVARAREGKIPPLYGMGLEEISALARLFRSPYNTYGKLRGYVEATGKMPPVDYERRENG